MVKQSLGTAQQKNPLEGEKQNSSSLPIIVPQSENKKSNIYACFKVLKWFIITAITIHWVNFFLQYFYALGTACGKLHQVSLMSIIDPGDSDILVEEN